MAIPLVNGSNPEIITLPADTWTKVFSGVVLGKITNLFNATDTVWLTYVRKNDSVPVGLGIPKWRMPAGFARFENGVASSDVYAYAVNNDLQVRVES